MYFDVYYLIFMIPALIFSLWAQSKVNSAFNKYSAVNSIRGMTGREAAEAVLRQNGVSGVAVMQVAGNLTDHYDPRDNVIRLSQNVYGSTSVAAIGVAAHEAGHAVQYAEGYAPVRWRQAIIPVTNFASKLAMPLFIVGLLMSSYGAKYINLAYIGIICFSLSVLFQLLTLPAETNASKRAVAAIDGSILTRDEAEGAKKVLSAAALTYLAALATSLLSLLRLILIANSRNRRR